MLTALVPRADWSSAITATHPAFAPIRPLAARFAAYPTWPPVRDWNPSLTDLSLRAASELPLRFVPRPRRRRRGACVVLADVYDVQIYERGEVQSRERSWHDFFNMLCWAVFPRAKAALNARQHRALRATIEDGAPRMPNTRPRERDALAMLDEGGALVLARTDEAAASVAQGAALEAAVARGDARVLLLGHAVYEHLASSGETVRALPVPLRVDAWPAGLDDAVRLADEALAGRLADPYFLAEPPSLAAIPVTRALFEATERVM